MNTYTLRNNLGKEFALSIDGPLPQKGPAMPMVFSDIVYATQFVNSLLAPPSLWRKLSHSQTIQTCRHSTNTDIAKAIAVQLIGRRIQVFALDNVIESVVPKSQRSLKGRNNTLVEFTPASPIKGSTKNTAQSFSSIKSAVTFIDSLSPSEAELKQIAKGVGVNVSSANTDEDTLKQKIAEKLKSGEAVVNVQVIENQTQLEHIEADSVANTSQPTLGPSVDSAPAAPVVTAASRDADQVAAMLQAAEDGTPFCEECAAEEEVAQNTQPQNADNAAGANEEDAAESNTSAEAEAEAPGIPPLAEGNDANTEEPECGVCTLKDYVVQCAHKRKQSLSGKLRIVPDPKKSRTKEVSMLGVTIQIKEEFGGSETVEASTVLDGNLRQDCAYISDHNGELQQTEKQEIVFEGVDGENLSRWPLHDAPQVHNIKAKACKGGEANVAVEVYPNQFYTVEGNLDVFKDWVDEVNKAWERWGERIFSYAPIGLTPKLEGPKGSFSAAWGWKEDSNWNAYFDVSASFGLNPIFGVEIELSLSATKLLTTMAGLPPVFGDVASKHLADVQFFAAAGCKGTLLGAPHGKKYPDDSFKVVGDAKFTVEGLVKLGFRLTAGSEYFAKVEVTCSGESKVIGSDTLEVNENGVFAQTNIDLEPLTAIVKVEYKYLVAFKKTNEQKWTPWEKIELYKSDKVKLLPV